MIKWQITVDQFGYRIGDEKVAVIVDPQEGLNKDEHFTPGKVYQVRRQSNSEVVYAGEPVPWNGGQVDDMSGDRAWWFDFSLLIEPGSYYIYDFDNNVQSYSFRIGDDIYERVLYHALRMFYYQRETQKHEAPNADYPWYSEPKYEQDRRARDVFAPEDESRIRDVSGGWMDAGDPNKYITFIHSAIHELLSSYESNPAFFKDFCLDIPESHLDAPDILSEIKWEIDWMLKMTNDDGSAHIKCGTPRGRAFNKYFEGLEPRVWHSMKSSAAAIGVAGMFAHAAIIYKTIPVYREFGEMLAEKAEKSWAWYYDSLKNGTRNEKVDNGEIEAGNANKSFIHQDMMAVAAAVYLYSLTGKEAYHDYIKENYKLLPPVAAEPNRRNHRAVPSGFIDSVRELGLGYIYYMGMEKADPAIVKELQDKYIEIAMNTDNSMPLQFVPEKSPYRGYLSKEMVHWGHLQMRGARGYDAFLLSELNLIPELSENFKENAANHLHYLHGVNPQSTPWIMNMHSAGASSSFKYMFHEWYMKMKEHGIQSPPGYLLGGPNMHMMRNVQLPPPDVMKQKGKMIRQLAAEHNKTGTYSNAWKWRTPSRLSPPMGEPPLKCYLDAPFLFSNIDSAYDGYASYAWTEPMCAYQASYVRLLACFVGKASVVVDAE